ncbi:MAG: PD-(D/E)XK nuclease family protein [Paludibacteraceae bacterium]|nr:PD-(D/E)XK nuclease family protein [Paludibacteraceae bacterium]
MDKSQNFLSFIDDFGRKYEEEKRRLPYHINVIDELHINENGHSRILAQLLCYVNEKGEYEILQSLVNYIVSCKKGESSFSRIRVNKPEITQEKGRIDLWVRDKDYAIIFENKIFNAVDQDAQIARYIETTRNYGYKDENIFVVYLSPKGEEPDPQTWGNFKNSFDDRYYNLSFRDNILPWLKEQVLPTVRLKDYHLQSAIQQYVDYLEGLFSLRNIQKTMNMNLEELVKNHLNFEGKNSIDCFKSLVSYAAKIGNLYKTVEAMEEPQKNKCMKEVRDELLKDRYIKDVTDREENVKRNYLSALSMKNEDEKDITVIIAQEGGSLYCEVRYDYDKVDEKEWKTFQDSKLGKYLLERRILTEAGDSGVWTWFDTDFEGVLQCFKETVIKCVKFIKQNKV